MSTPDDASATESATETDSVLPQPLRDGDTSVTADPADDPAQAEWDRTTALDEGTSPDDLDAMTATGDDPDQIPSDDDQIPAADLPADVLLPETQGDDPVVAELGEDGAGDLSPEDL